MAYTTLEEVRNVPPLSESVDRYPDAALEEGIAWAEERIDQITGTSWGDGNGNYKSTTLTFDGTNTYVLWTEIPFIRTITSATLAGVNQTVTNWTGTDDGYVRADVPFVGLVSMTVEYGASKVVPVDIQWAARTLARWYVLRLNSQVPDDAVNIVSEGGTVVLAQPGRYGPTALPEVNAVLMSRSHRFPSIG